MMAAFGTISFCPDLKPVIQAIHVKFPGSGLYAHRLACTTGYMTAHLTPGIGVTYRGFSTIFFFDQTINPKNLIASAKVLREDINDSEKLPCKLVNYKQATGSDIGVAKLVQSRLADGKSFSATKALFGKSYIHVCGLDIRFPSLPAPELRALGIYFGGASRLDNLAKIVTDVDEILLVPDLQLQVLYLDGCICVYDLAFADKLSVYSLIGCASQLENSPDENKPGNSPEHRLICTLGGTGREQAHLAGHFLWRRNVAESFETDDEVCLNVLDWRLFYPRKMGPPTLEEDQRLVFPKSVSTFSLTAGASLWPPPQTDVVYCGEYAHIFPKEKAVPRGLRGLVAPYLASKSNTLSLAVPDSVPRHCPIKESALQIVQKPRYRARLFYAIHQQYKWDPFDSTSNQRPSPYLDLQATDLMVRGVDDELLLNAVAEELSSYTDEPMLVPESFEREWESLLKSKGLIEIEMLKAWSGTVTVLSQVTPVIGPVNAVAPDEERQMKGGTDAGEKEKDADTAKKTRVRKKKKKGISAGEKKKQVGHENEGRCATWGRQGTLPSSHIVLSEEDNKLLEKLVQAWGEQKGKSVQQP